MTTAKPIICAANLSDRAAIIDTLAQAFQDDPAMCWIVPDPEARAKCLPRMFSIIVPLDFASGTVLHSLGHEVATLWRAPGQAETSTWTMMRHAIPLLRAFGFSLGRAMTIGDAIDAHHPKEFDYSYLHYAAVRPDHQGKGWGGAAIRAGIAQAEAADKPTYLETATLSNVGLYQRLGFQVIEEWDVPRGGPHFWSMLRLTPHSL
jgi:ribosomal protein S18 acetylase RimI-like enzyme